MTDVVSRGTDSFIANDWWEKFVSRGTSFFGEIGQKMLFHVKQHNGVVILGCCKAENVCFT